MNHDVILKYVWPKPSYGVNGGPLPGEKMVISPESLELLVHDVGLVPTYVSEGDFLTLHNSLGVGFYDFSLFMEFWLALCLSVEGENDEEDKSARGQQLQENDYGEYADFQETMITLNIPDNDKVLLHVRYQNTIDI